MSGKKISRRNFLRNASCAAIGTTTMFNAIANMSMANVLAAPKYGAFPLPPTDYKAMVCILLAGGNDSYNMLVPRSAAAYSQYQTTRSGLALNSGDLHNLNYTDANGKQFGVHPSMPEVQQLFNNGKLSFLANVGTLIEPATLAQLQSGAKSFPLGLLSHADQIQQWQTSIPHVRSSKGWGGKMADIMNVANTNPDISMSISLAGTNIFQQGNDTIEFAITNQGNGSKGIELYDQTGSFETMLSGNVQSILNEQYQDIFKKTYADRINASQDAHVLFSSALGGVSPFVNPFSGASKISKDLNMVAKTIAASDTLGMHKQTFFIQIGGWDHHDELLLTQGDMLAELSVALDEFNTVMEELNIADKVTTFTISDFARTLTSNGNGSDHGWGGNVMVMGGDVNGGQVFGEYPDLVLGSNIELGGGVYMPTTSIDEYFAELALWFGVDSTDLPDLLPNIQNFYTLGGAAPIGFMNI